MDLRKNIILHLNPWVYVQLHISATSLGDKVMTSIKYNRDFGRSLASGCFPFLDSRSFEERSHVKHLIQSTDILTCFILVSHSYQLLLLLLLSRFSHVRLCATPETAAHQALASMGLSRQEYWSGVPLPSPSYQLLTSNYSWGLHILFLYNNTFQLW